MLDNWKDETLLRLNKSQIYLALKSKCQENDTDALTLVNSGVFYAYQRTKTIIRHMGEFTLHDSDHLFNVLNLMELLLGEQNIKHLSTPELMLLILSAFFHDIGMSPEEKEVLTFRKIWDCDPTIFDEEEKIHFDGFNRFYSTQLEKQEAIKKFQLQGQLSEADTLKSLLITEYIRQTHAERSREIIAKDWSDKIRFRDVDLTIELAQLTYGHNEDALSLLEMDKHFLCGQHIYACLPLIGIILRLADILDFDAKRTPSILYSHLYVRNPVSIKEWNKHRSIDAWEITPENIQFSATCTHPAIEASIHEFCDIIDHELSLCHNIAFTLNEFNKLKGREISLKFPFKTNREKIKTKRNIHNKPLYIYRETKFQLSKRQVIDLLMGTKLYGSQEVALRELLQNSIDACLLRQAQEQKWGNPYNPEISVKYYLEDGDEILEVIDNGTEMDEYIIDNYYSKVGSSFYTSTDFYNLKADTNAEFKPTSRFGIGILSCFMVADTLIVDTKRAYTHHRSSDSLNITVEGQDSIFWIRPGKRELPGTTTKLILRKTKNPWEKMTEEEFVKSVETVIPNPPFKIKIETNSHKSVRDQNSFKEITADILKDYSWTENENIRTFEIRFDNEEFGIIGTAVAAILESHNTPVESLDIILKDVEIEGNIYSLRKSLTLMENRIKQDSTSITINDEKEIKEDTSLNFLVSSKSRLSLHGIEVPTSLFPDFWFSKNNQVKISWPFPVLLVFDIYGIGDLDLNSSRTQIIMSDKWIKCEEELAFQICSGIATTVNKIYWETLKAILLKSTKNDRFIRGINRVLKN